MVLIPVRAARTTRSSPENQPQISANGQRVSANNYQIDGVSVNSLSHGGAAVVTPNQESVKEIQISSTSYSAEDGRNSGAQIKVVSQNGTNVFHGSAFIKYDSPKLNAFNKYPNDFGRGRRRESRASSGSLAAASAVHCTCRGSAKADQQSTAARIARSSFSPTKDYARTPRRLPRDTWRLRNTGKL